MAENILKIRLSKLIVAADLALTFLAGQRIYASLDSRGAVTKSKEQN